MTSALKHINIPGLVTANCTRIDQRGLGSHRAVFRDASISVPGNGFDDAGIQIHLVDAPVFQVGNVQLVPLRIQCDAHNVVELRLGSLPAVSAEPGHSGSSDGSDLPVGIDLSNAMISAIGNVHGIIRANGDVMHSVKRRLAKRTSITPVTFAAVPADVSPYAVGQTVHPAPLEFDNPHAAL